MPIVIIKYAPQYREEWNSFVKKASNATFLFEREYMEYHSSRFNDCSLMFFRDKKLLALLPANILPEESILQTHGGLTYGGLIILPKTKTTEVIEIFAALTDYMRSTLNVKSLLYKAMPYIYNTTPADAPLYALFHSGANIVARSISTTIDNGNKQALGEQRKRGIKRAEKAGVNCSPSVQFKEFWNILINNLRTVHNCTPTHTLDEIELLHKRFPESIKLYTANIESDIVAGIVVYETDNVAHFQYIAASPTGKAKGALDALVAYLMDVYINVRYIDFGISTEQGGRLLNEGLIGQKEGFGGRAVVYDTYELKV